MAAVTADLQPRQSITGAANPIATSTGWLL